MKTNEIIAEMQKNLTALAEHIDHQEELIQRYKDAIKKLQEQNSELEDMIKLFIGATKEF